MLIIVYHFDNRTENSKLEKGIFYTSIQMFQHFSIPTVHHSAIPSFNHLSVCSFNLLALIHPFILLIYLYLFACAMQSLFAAIFPFSVQFWSKGKFWPKGNVRIVQQSVTAKPNGIEEFSQLRRYVSLVHSFPITSSVFPLFQIRSSSSCPCQRIPAIIQSNFT